MGSLVAATLAQFRVPQHPTTISRQLLPAHHSALSALDQRVHILRVHDVAETRQAVAVWDRLTSLVRKAGIPEA